MKRAYVGIDPGLGGAIALIAPEYVSLQDMPVVAKKSGKNEVDAQSLLALFDGMVLHDHEYYCLLERVHAAPVQGRRQGVAGMFSMGDSFGVARALAQTCFHRIDYVVPQKWKREMQLNKDKGYSLAVARKAFPLAFEQLKLKKHEGRAEALLLAKYAQLHHSW